MSCPLSSDRCSCSRRIGFGSGTGSRREAERAGGGTYDMRLSIDFESHL
jgi:hypothetical protein